MSLDMCRTLALVVCALGFNSLCRHVTQLQSVIFSYRINRDVHQCMGKYVVNCNVKFVF